MTSSGVEGGSGSDGVTGTAGTAAAGGVAAGLGRNHDDSVSVDARSIDEKMGSEIPTAIAVTTGVDRGR